MSIVQLAQKEDNVNVFSAAFHADVHSEAEAQSKLEGHAPGTYLTFSVQKQNFCASVGHDGQLVVKPFGWLASGFWFNGALATFATEFDLLSHLVDGQIAIALRQD